MAPLTTAPQPPSVPTQALFLSADILHWEKPPQHRILSDWLRRISLPGLSFGTTHVTDDLAWVAPQYRKDHTTGQLVFIAGKTQEEREGEKGNVSPQKVDTSIKKLQIEIFIEVEKAAQVLKALPGAINEIEELADVRLPIVKLCSGKSRGDENRKVSHPSERRVLGASGIPSVASLAGSSPGMDQRSEGTWRNSPPSVGKGLKNGKSDKDGWARYLNLVGESKGSVWKGPEYVQREKRQEQQQDHQRQQQKAQQLQQIPREGYAMGHEKPMERSRVDSFVCST
jgi:hypothetical protein